MSDRRLSALLAASAIVVAGVLVPSVAVADHTDAPTSVSVPGSFNSELGCPGDFQPDCPFADLVLQVDGTWRATLDIPAGSYTYKVAIDDDFAENYGAGGVPNGPDVAIEATGAPVIFVYDPVTHYFTSSVEAPIVTAVGSFQSALGCASDFAPDCLRSWLRDADGDGTFSFATSGIPAGTYSAKVTHDLTFDENYGADGEPDGANIDFSTTNGELVTFSYDIETNVLTITVGSPTPTPPPTPSASAPELVATGSSPAVAMVVASLLLLAGAAFVGIVRSARAFSRAARR